jgi:hypothetical protein
MALLLLSVLSLKPALARYDYASAVHAVRHDENKVRHDKNLLYRLYARLAEVRREHDWRGIQRTRRQIWQVRTDLHHARYALLLDRHKLYYRER